MSAVAELLQVMSQSFGILVYVEHDYDPRVNLPIRLTYLHVHVVKTRPLLKF